MDAGFGGFVCEKQSLISHTSVNLSEEDAWDRALNGVACTIRSIKQPYSDIYFQCVARCVPLRGKKFEKCISRRYISVVSEQSAGASDTSS